MMRVIPKCWRKARKIADKALDDPASVDRQMAGRAITLAALNGR